MASSSGLSHALRSQPYTSSSQHTHAYLTVGQKMESVFTFVSSPALAPAAIVDLLVHYIVEVNTHNSHMGGLVQLAAMDMVDRFIAEPFKLMSRFKKQEEVELHVYQRFFSVLTQVNQRLP